MRTSDLDAAATLPWLTPMRLSLGMAGFCLLIMLFGLVVAPYGLELTLRNSTSITPGLGLNLGVQYASAFVGGVLMVCYALALVIEVIRGRKSP